MFDKKTNVRRWQAAAHILVNFQPFSGLIFNDNSSKINHFALGALIAACLLGRHHRYVPVSYTHLSVG